MTGIEREPGPPAGAHSTDEEDQVLSDQEPTDPRPLDDGPSYAEALDDLIDSARAVPEGWTYLRDVKVSSLGDLLSPAGAFVSLGNALHHLGRNLADLDHAEEAGSPEEAPVTGVHDTSGQAPTPHEQVLAAIESGTVETHQPPRTPLPDRICASMEHETIPADFLGVYDAGFEVCANVSYCAACAAIYKDEFRITQTLVRGLVCSCGKGARRGPLHEHSCPVFIQWSHRETAGADASGRDADE